MREVMNKSLSTKNKSNKSKDILAEVLEVAGSLADADPGKRQVYIDGISKAREAQKIAQFTKENAETEKDFDEAFDTENRAKEKELFFMRKLDEYDTTQRLEKDAYDEYVNKVKGLVYDTADDFRAVIEKAVEALVPAYRKLHKLGADASEALARLDAVANVLQSEYKDKVFTFANAPDAHIRDINEWRNHVTRFDGCDLNNYVSTDFQASDPSEPPKYNYEVSCVLNALVKIVTERDRKGVD